MDLLTRALRSLHARAQSLTATPRALAVRLLACRIAGLAEWLPTSLCGDLPETVARLHDRFEGQILGAPGWERDSAVAPLWEDVQALPAEALPSPDPLGAAYERLLAFPEVPEQPALNRALGAHYTPPPVVDAMIRWSLPDAPAPYPTVLDPACGAGAFLTGALRALAKRFPTVPPGELAVQALRGIDLDPLAVEVARMNLALCAASLGDTHTPVADLARCITVADALDRRAEGPPRADVVVGNPPYVFGEYLAEANLPHLQATYALAGGQPDLYALFLERALADLLAPGGCLGMIVPDAVLARDDRRDVRAWIGRQARVERVAHVGQVFRGIQPDGKPRTVGISAVVLILRQGAWSTHATAHPWPAGEPFPIPLPADPGNPWSVNPASATLRPLLDAMRDAPGILGDLLLNGAAGATRGEELGKGNLAALGSRTACPGCTGILAGECVRRWRVMPPRHQARLDDVRKTNRYGAPRVLVVKTGSTPVAAADRGELPVLQSVYVLHLDPAQAGPWDVDAVAGLLNACTLGAFTVVQWTGQKRLQPQLTLGNVRVLPLPPRLNAAGIGELARLSRALREQSGRRLLAGSCMALEERVCRLITEGFGCDWRAIKPSLAAVLSTLPRSQRPAWVLPPNS